MSRTCRSGVKLGINVAELFELNPDITQVRGRMLADGAIKRDTYFSAADFNRYSAQFIMAMSKEKVLDKITHVIWHAYGAESPYSCSYYGMKRFRRPMPSSSRSRRTRFRRSPSRRADGAGL